MIAHRNLPVEQLSIGSSRDLTIMKRILFTFKESGFLTTYAPEKPP
jgi:hypothetical protein